MAKGIVEIHGKEVQVREDTYRAYRGVKWALISIFAFIAIVAVLFLSGLLTASTDGELKDPAAASNTQPQ